MFLAWLCPSRFPGSRACSMPSGSLLSSLGLAAQLPCHLWHRISTAWSFLVLLPFAVSPESLPQLGGERGVWLLPLNTLRTLPGNVLGTQREPWPAESILMGHLQIFLGKPRCEQAGSAQQLELLISARAAGFPVRPRVHCTICPSNPLTSGGSEGPFRVSNHLH